MPHTRQHRQRPKQRLQRIVKEEGRSRRAMAPRRNSPQHIPANQQKRPHRRLPQIHSVHQGNRATTPLATHHTQSRVTPSLTTHQTPRINRRTGDLSTACQRARVYGRTAIHIRGREMAQNPMIAASYSAYSAYTTVRLSLSVQHRNPIVTGCTEIGKPHAST